MARKKVPVDPSAKISANFYWRGFLASATAKRRGIRNVIYQGSKEEASATALFNNVVQPVRTRLSCPLFQTSGYRCPELNKAVGGSSTSQHPKAEAVDLHSERHTPMALAKAFRDYPGGLSFDQLILEHDQGIVHVSHSRDEDNRGEVLTRYVDSNGDLQYVYGLRSEDECHGS